MGPELLMHIKVRAVQLDFFNFGTNIKKSLITKLNIRVTRYYSFGELYPWWILIHIIYFNHPMTWDGDGSRHTILTISCRESCFCFSVSLSARRGLLFSFFSC